MKRLEGKAILTGWKEICLASGLSRQTLKELAANEGFPIVYIGKKPCCTTPSMHDWFAEKAQKRRQ